MWIYDENVTYHENDDDLSFMISNGSSSSKKQNHPKIKTELLSKIINKHHTNVKYLPSIPLPHNIIAMPLLHEAARDATLIIFVVPHQFLSKEMFTTLSDVVAQNGNCRAISLVKGLDFVDLDDYNSGGGGNNGGAVKIKRPSLISDGVIVKGMMASSLKGSSLFQCGVLMGANVANDLAVAATAISPSSSSSSSSSLSSIVPLPCESTLACNFHESSIPSPSNNDNLTLNQRTLAIFHTPSIFRVKHVRDVAGTEVCGALKNVIALGAGFVDALSSSSSSSSSGGSTGGNTKAALIRVGLHEMKLFAKRFFGNAVKDETFLESCGIADLIVTCYNGRNRKCAEEFAHRRQLSTGNQNQHQHQHQNHSHTVSETCSDLWTTIEHDLLKGQKLQGTSTCDGVISTLDTLSSSLSSSSFPLMRAIHGIAFLGNPVESILDGIVIMDDNEVCDEDEEDGKGGTNTNSAIFRSKL